MHESYAATTHNQVADNSLSNFQITNNLSNSTYDDRRNNGIKLIANVSKLPLMVTNFTLLKILIRTFLFNIISITTGKKCSEFI